MLGRPRRVTNSGRRPKGRKLRVLIGCCRFSSPSRSHIRVLLVMSYTRNTHVKLLINRRWANRTCDRPIANVPVACRVSTSATRCSTHVLSVPLTKKIKSVAVFRNTRTVVLPSMHGLLMVWSCRIINAYYRTMNITRFVSHNLRWREHLSPPRTTPSYPRLGNPGHPE